MVNSERVEALRQMVSAANGIWVGVQEGLGRPHLVLFNSPNTGSTYSLPDNEFLTVNEIAAKIHLMDKKFKGKK
jgi:hypothetical protein